MPNAGRGELGDFLRSRREKLDPEALGVRDGRRRRTPGLRREEVAERAGIGVDWYIRLEQGRAVSPSVTTIDALARALRLNAVDHTHLRALARSPGRAPFTREVVPDSLRLMINAMSQPAYVTGRRWDVLAWNDAADENFGFSRLPESDRNTLLSMLIRPESRQLFGEAWENEAKRMVAQFRATHDLWAGDPAFAALVERLRASSKEFSAWWETHDIRNSGSGQKTLHRPGKEPLRFDYATFHSNDDPALKLAVYTLVD